MVVVPRWFILLLILGAGCGRTSFFDLGPGSAPSGSSDIDAGLDGGVGICKTAVEVFGHQILNYDAVDAPERVFPASGSVVFAEPPDQQRDSRILRADLTTMIASPVGRGALMVLDADERSALLLRDRRQLELHREGRSLTLGTAAMPVTVAPVPAHHLSGDLVGACTSDFSIGAIELSSGVRFETLSQEGPCSEPVFLAGRDLVYLRTMGPEGFGEIVHWRAELNAAQPRTIHRSPALSIPVLFGGRAFTIDRGDLVAIALDGSGQIERIKEGPCVAIDANALGVLVACGPDGLGPDPRLGMAKELLFYDGQQLRRLQTGDQGVRLPRLGDSFATWLAYAPEVELCSGGRNAGQVMAAGLDGTPAVKVTEVDLGCLCCGAFWPNPFLEARGDTIAFNYDSASPDLRSVRVGVARIRPGCR